MSHKINGRKKKIFSNDLPGQSRYIYIMQITCSQFRLKFLNPIRLGMLIFQQDLATGLMKIVESIKFVLELAFMRFFLMPSNRAPC